MRDFSIMGIRLSLVFCAITQVLTSPSHISGYTVVDAVWEVQLTPGSPRTTMNGTIEQVAAQLAERSPNWMPEVVQTSKRDSLADFEYSWHWCGIGNSVPPYNPAAFGEIQEGVKYLKSHHIPPTVPAGPKLCVRISCSWGSAIHWCNDNDHSLRLDNNGPLIEATERLYDCKYSNLDWELLIVGQVFTKGNWNVLIADDANC